MWHLSGLYVGLRTRGWGLETRLLRQKNFRPRRGMTLTLSNHMAYRFLVTFNYGLFKKNIYQLQ